MAKEKAIYAPGELDKVRGKLGPLDQEEAKRMMKVLGGEVGVERNDAGQKGRPLTRNQTAAGSAKSQGGRAGQTSRSGGRPAGPQGESASNKRANILKTDSQKDADGADDPSTPLKLSYRERIKMDRYAAQPEFEIKTSMQVLYSILSFFGDSNDYVSHIFVTKRLNEYYKHIELLVSSTRNLFPRNNINRNEQLRKASSFAYSVLDTIRYWNIERISSELARLQARPRNVKTTDLSDVMRAVYKPLFILENLDLETHIKECYKLLYKLLYQESSDHLRTKHQEYIRGALGALTVIRRDIRFLLYPLLMKLVSSRWLPYERFFVERRNRLMAFLNVSEKDRISSVGVLKARPDQKSEKEPEPEREDEKKKAEELEDEEKKAKKQSLENEKKAVERGLKTLEVLFPKAGWDQLSSFPDIYPYFLDVFDLKRDYSLIPPADPLQQVTVLLRILEELIYGLRYVSFGTIISPEGTERLDEVLNPMINNWHYNIENSLEKEYLPRLAEYCHILESNIEARTSSYARRLINELHWSRRFYFLPYYKFESTIPPPIKKKNIAPLYSEVRTLRKYLTMVAAGIEQANKQGGAEKKAPCNGIDNPWQPYMFQVPNPVSKRLNAVLGQSKRNNASLVFFSLAVSTVLDYLVNNENSWAYSDRPGPVVRNGEGGAPLLGVNSSIDTTAIFDAAMREKERNTKEALVNPAPDSDQIQEAAPPDTDAGTLEKPS